MDGIITRAPDSWRAVMLGVSVPRPAADGANDDGGRVGWRSDMTTATRRPGGRSAVSKSSREPDPLDANTPGDSAEGAKWSDWKSQTTSAKSWAGGSVREEAQLRNVLGMEPATGVQRRRWPPPGVALI